jgi:hypothetical protein
VKGLRLGFDPTLIAFIDRGGQGRGGGKFEVGSLKFEKKTLKPEV